MKFRKFNALKTRERDYQDGSSTLHRRHDTQKTTKILTKYCKYFFIFVVMCVPLLFNTSNIFADTTFLPTTSAPMTSALTISALTTSALTTSAPLISETFPRKQEPDLSIAPRDTCCGDKYMDIIKPINDTSVFMKSGVRGFYAGFRNQMMTFTAQIMWARKNNWGQIIYHDSLNFKDTFGSEDFIPFDWLFDVEQWNSYYPSLPRLISCNNLVHSDIDCENKKWLGVREEATSPYSLHIPQHKLLSHFFRYTNGNGPLATEIHVDKLMKQGALSPNKELLDHINTFLTFLAKNGNITFMTLHPRVEPDMVEHPTCLEKKENNLTRIIEHMEAAFPDPPAPNILITLNRDLIEKKGQINRENPNQTDWIAVENLAALNRAISEGLWSGRVKAFEFGTNSLSETKFARYPSTVGAWVNFYLAAKSEVFIGSEVSTWAHDVMKTRFFRGNLNNYIYFPTGIEPWTTQNMTKTPNFKRLAC